MKYLKLEEFDAGIGQEYAAPRYPHLGLFLNRRASQIFSVYQQPGMLVPCVVGFFFEPGSLTDDLPTPAAPPAPQFSEDFFLKAIAISQQPALAHTLLAKPA